MAKMTWLGDKEGDLEWLQSVHKVPSDMSCAILYGNEDSPEKIHAWRIYNAPHDAPPDWEYIQEKSTEDNG